MHKRLRDSLKVYIHRMKMRRWRFDQCIRMIFVMVLISCLIVYDIKGINE